MKKILTLFCLLIILKNSFAQSTQKTPDAYATLSFGVGIPSIDNHAFDAWTQANYNKKYNNKVSVNIDLGGVYKNFDAGLYFTGSSADFRTFTLYAGRKLTSATSPLVSFLNFEVGGISITNRSLAPLNYVRSPDEEGQDMQLNYSATYLGIYSKNYLNNLSFNIGKKKHVSVKPGFYLNFEYQVGGGTWKYGYLQDNGSNTYYNEDGTSYTTTETKFVGKKIHDIPQLASKFLNAGVFIAITAF